MIVIVKRITIHVQSFFCVCVCMPEQIEAVNCKYDKLQHKFITFSLSDILNFRGWITSVFYSIPSILQHPQSVFKGANFCRFLTSFLLSYVGALSSIITGHKGLLFFEEWDGIFHVQCNVCANTGPPILSPIREDQVM